MTRYMVACVACALAFWQLSGVAAAQQCDGGVRQITYVVRSGDSLTSVAEKYALSIDDLVKVNPPLTNRSLVLTNQALTIPVCNDPPAPSPAAPTTAPAPAAASPAPAVAAQQAPAPTQPTTTTATKSSEPGPATPAIPAGQPVSMAPAQSAAPAASARPSASDQGQRNVPASPEPSTATHPIDWDKSPGSQARLGEGGNGVESLLIGEAPKAVFVILLAGAAMWLLWRYWGRQPLSVRARSARLTILETRKLGTRHALYVVGYGSRVFLIGAAQGNINLLADLAPGQAAQREAGGTADDVSSDFADQLARAVEDPTPADTGELHLQSPTRDLLDRIRDTTESLRRRTNRLRDYGSQPN